MLRSGLVEHTVKLTRINSKILSHANTYLLFDPLKNTKHRRTAVFDYTGYFGAIAEHENIKVASNWYLDASRPLLFCMFMSNFLRHLYDKYGARTMYYSPKNANYYEGGVFGFVFVDKKRQLFFELLYNNLREKYSYD